MNMKAQEHYEAGNLREAIAAALEDVKKNPADSGKRGFLCEMLCLAGDWNAPTSSWTPWATQDPKAMMGVTLFRQLIRAEQARQQFYTDGRLPEFLNQEVTPDLRLSPGSGDPAAGEKAR